ncbi:MAG: hypothetical protein ACXIVQ_15080 [Acidimicrobiales bacterium]
MSTDAEARRRIEKVLAGHHSYDDLRSPAEQAHVRAVWQQRIDDRLRRLNLAAQFVAQQHRWVELDDSGQVVERTPGSNGEISTRVIGNS